MADDVSATLPGLLISAAGSLVDEIQRGVEARGFHDLRPAHGFAFARLAPVGATVGEVGLLACSAALTPSLLPGARLVTHGDTPNQDQKLKHRPATGSETDT